MQDNDITKAFGDLQKAMDKVKEKSIVLMKDINEWTSEPEALEARDELGNQLLMCTLASITKETIGSEEALRLGDPLLSLIHLSYFLGRYCGAHKGVLNYHDGPRFDADSMKAIDDILSGLTP